MVFTRKIGKSLLKKNPFLNSTQCAYLNDESSQNPVSELMQLIEFEKKMAPSGGTEI
tara:strand:- start:258 stop:428 length:171 start_codon:yes stop_codon:yes gene_type:complete